MVRFLFHLFLLVCFSLTAVRSEFDCDATQCPSKTPYCTTAGCVTTCPDNSFANGTRCVLNCGDGVADGNICKDVCPADKNLTTENIIVVGTTFEQVRFCVGSCDIHLFAYKNKCAIECPADAMYVVNRKCESTCPDNQNFRIEKKTSSNTTYVECANMCDWNKPVHKNQTCVSKCDDGEVVFERSCVVECPAGFEYLQRKIMMNIKDKVCVKDCGDEYYFGKDCVPYCPAGMPIANKSCVHSCPSSTPFTYKSQSYYWDNYGKHYINICVAECPIGMLYDNNTCTKTCPAKIYNRTCAMKCPYSYPFSSITNNCLHQCPDSTFAINFTCELSCPNVSFNHECVSSCPSATFLENNKCVDDCHINMYYNGEECVSKCPREGYVFNRTCVKNCPLSSPLLENRNCVRECQQHMYYSGEVCVSMCPKEEYGFNRTCVKKCPPPFYLLENRNCVSECQPNMYISAEECVSRCPNENDFIYNKTCVTVCPSEAPIKYDSCKIETCYSYRNTYHPIRCVQKCPKSFSLNLTCVKQCPNMVNDSQCVEECPSEAPIKYDSCKIETCYSYRNTYHPIRCVQKCPKSFSLNLTCVKQCPNMVNDSQCVEECPNNKPYIDKHSYPSYNECVTKCSDAQIANGSYCIAKYECELPIVYDGKCLDMCPNGMYWLGQSKRRGVCESVWVLYGAIIGSFIFMAIIFPGCMKFFRFQPMDCGSTLFAYGTKFIGRKSRQTEGYQPLLEEETTADAEGIELVV